MADKDASASVPSSNSKRSKRKARNSTDMMKLILEPDSLLGNPNPTHADQPSNSNNLIAADDYAESEDQETEHREAEHQVVEHSLQENFEEESEAEVTIPIKKRDTKRFVKPEDEVKDFMVSFGPMTQSMSSGFAHTNADTDSGGGGGGGCPMTSSCTPAPTDIHNADAARMAKEVMMMTAGSTTQSQDKGKAVIETSADNGGDDSDNKNKPSKQFRRICVECDSDQSSTKNPTWRPGPEGPGTLCNSCGLKYARKRKNTKK